MGTVRIRGASNGRNVYTKQPTATQVTLKDAKNKDIKMAAGEYAYLNYPSELHLDSPTGVTHDRSGTVITNTTWIGAMKCRRPQYLSNGWIVQAVFITNRIDFIVSKDGGGTWSTLCYCSDVKHGNFSITSRGTKIYVACATYSNFSMYFMKFDAATQGNTDIASTTVQLFSAGYQVTKVDIVISSDGTTIGVLGQTSNGSYSNLFHKKSVDDGVTWTKKDGTAGQDQLTSISSDSYQIQEAYLVLDTGNSPVIVWKNIQNGSTYSLTVSYWIGSSYNATNFADPTTSPLIGVAITTDNVIHLVYDKELGSMKYRNLSADRSTWSTEVTIGGATTLDFRAHICLTAIGTSLLLNVTRRTASSAFKVSILNRVGSTWDANFTDIVSLTTDLGWSAFAQNAPTYINPLIVYGDYNAFSQKFYGKWSQSNSPQLIPAFEAAASTTELQAIGKGTLKSSGSVPKIYMGNITKKVVS